MTDDYERVKRERMIDEAATAMLDRTPRMLWTFCERLKEEGFSDDQAFKLTQVWLFSMTPFGVLYVGGN